MNSAGRSGIRRQTDVAECIFFHSQVRWNKMSNPISDVNHFITQLIWGFKKTLLFRPCLYIEYISLFWHLMFRPFSTLDFTIPCMKYITTHCHSAQHTHAHLGWPHSVIENKLLFFWQPVDGDIFILFILLLLLKTYHTRTDGYKSHSNQEGRALKETVGESVLPYVLTQYMHMHGCVFVCVCHYLLCSLWRAC